jgi:hypothetical protein
MKEMLILEQVYGYKFELCNGQIKYVHEGNILVDEQEVKYLLHEIKKRQSEAVAYLTGQWQPIDIAEHLWDAAEKAERSAHNAEANGNHEFALKELQRTARLCAAAAQASGAVDPHIPWDQWVAGFDALNGDMKKV